MLYPPYTFDSSDPAAFVWNSHFNLAGLVGDLCWVIAYALIAYKCFKEKAYGIPALAICLNFGWEILGSFVFPNKVALWEWLYRIWFVGDLFIVYQLFRYGRDLQTIPEVRRHFHAIMVFCILAGIAGQYAFVLTYEDRIGFVAAFMINLVMSILFPFMFLARKQTRRGISVGGAWFKMFGTLFVSYQTYYLVPLMDHPPSMAFVLFLAGMIFFFDCLYVYMVSRPAPETAGSPEAAPA